MTSIILENLAHAYRPNPSSPADYALKQATQIWESGGAYALLGPSGCGKTTLLNIISGRKARFTSLHRKRLVDHDVRGRARWLLRDDRIGTATHQRLDRALIISLVELAV